MHGYFILHFWTIITYHRDFNRHKQRLLPIQWLENKNRKYFRGNIVSKSSIIFIADQIIRTRFITINTIMSYVKHRYKIIISNIKYL